MCKIDPQLQYLWKFIKILFKFFKFTIALFSFLFFFTYFDNEEREWVMVRVWKKEIIKKNQENWYFNEIEFGVYN